MCTRMLCPVVTWRLRRLASSHTSLAARYATGGKMECLTSYDSLLACSKAAFEAAVLAVQPSHLIKSNVHVNKNTLSVKGIEFPLKRPCHVVGFGKAVLDMAISLEEQLGESMKMGIVSVPVGSLKSQYIPIGSRIQVLEGALNNLPDEMAEKNASIILNLAESLGIDDTLVVLISGGGSALLPLPLAPLKLSEKYQVIKQLANAGADIMQLNCVRKRLSSVKGGRLSAAAHPASVVSLILSDVIGDPIDIIASGPTSPNTDSPHAALDVIHQFNLQESLPQSVQICLSSGESPVKHLNDVNVHNILIGNNLLALNAAKAKMESLNFSVCILSKSIQGNVSSVAKFYSNLGAQVCETLTSDLCSFPPCLEKEQLLLPGVRDQMLKALNNSHSCKGICLIAGGETTVHVTGKGKGGRNQELALRFAENVKNLASDYDCLNKFNVSLLSAGTDGIDGPTDAAGAFGYAQQLYGQEHYKKYLDNNDSYNFYSQLDGGKNLIVTGHTGTNVMDIHVLTIEKKV